MFDFLDNIIDRIKGKERADWVVNTWKSNHSDEYDKFVANIEKMSEGDMSAAFEMYAMMKTCMPPEAEQYYNIMLRLFTGEANAMHDITKLQHANEIGECAINGKTLEINISSGEISITDSPRKGRLIVNASDVLKQWDELPLYNKAYCKDQYEHVKSTLPASMRNGALDVVLNLVKIHYVANLVFMPGMMANLYDKAINEESNLLFAMYYFVTFDHGLQHMARIFSSVVNNDVPGVDGITIFKSTIHNLTMTSLSNGWDSKESWKDVAENSDNDETWKEIMHAIRNSKPKHGRLPKTMTLDDILTGKDKVKQKKLIREFLEEYSGQFGPAYLRWCLDHSFTIKAVPYMVFHRALEAYLNKQINFKKPQERYGLLKNQQDKTKRHVRIWNEVAEITQKWVPLFQDI